MITPYCTYPVFLRNVVSRDAFNTPTTADTAAMALVVWKTKLVRNIKGEQVVAAGTVKFPSSVTAITHETKIVIDGVAHSILALGKSGDFEFSHWEVAIQ